GNGLFWGFVLWYFVCAFVAIFMNAALVACVRKRLAGGDPTVGYGLKEAFKKIVPIILWSLLTTTVGLLLRALSNSAGRRGGIIGIVGKIIAGILGFAWAILTMFVIPVIMTENLGVVDSLKKSGQLLKKTWGEQLIMTVGVSI